MYSRINKENLPLQIQIKLSRKPEIFCAIFFEFYKSTLNIECYKKKMSLLCQVFLKDIDSEGCAYLNLEQRLFLKTLWQ